MTIKELENICYEKFKKVKDECIALNELYLSECQYNVGDYIVKNEFFPLPYPSYKQQNQIYRIISMEVQWEEVFIQKDYMNIPKIKVRCNKCTLNKEPTKGFYDFNLDHVKPYVKEEKLITKKNRCTYVYLIEAGDIYKIGFSNNPEKRLYQIQTSNPHICKILFKIADPLGTLEKDLHKQFGSLRLNGEWFTKSDLIYKSFEKLAIDNGTSLRNTLSLFN